MKSFLRNKYLYAVILSLIGFLDSSYLTILHFKETIPPCTISGCETVLTSAYSEIFGIPVSLFGAFYFFSMLILSTYLLTNKSATISKVFIFSSIVGIFASIYFLMIQIFVLDAFCQYCILTEIMTLGLVSVGLIEAKNYRSSGR